MAQDVTINGMLAFLLADMLGMTLIESKDGQSLSGSSEVKIDLGGMEIAHTQRVIGWLINRDVHFVMVRSIGNLLLLASATKKPRGEEGRVSVLNLAKLDGAPEDFLSKRMPSTHRDATAMLGKAVVKTFGYSNNKWSVPRS